MQLDRRPSSNTRSLTYLRNCTVSDVIQVITCCKPVRDVQMLEKVTQVVRCCKHNQCNLTGGQPPRKQNLGFSLGAFWGFFWLRDVEPEAEEHADISA